VRVPAARAEVVAAEACAALGTGCSERDGGGGAVLLEFWTARGPDGPRRLRAALERAGVGAEIAVDEEDEGWRRALQSFHRPVEVAGTLLIRPPWADPRPGLLDVVIDPGMAFGTGQHGTTRACLALLADLPRSGSVLDAGCGSGVLAIAARRLGHDPVIAIDADPLAVEATVANARRNGVGLTVARRIIGRDRLPEARVILANLTLTILAGLARSLPVSPPEHMLLSGLRPHEADRAAGLFSGHGLGERRRVDDDGWATLRLDRR
jgi:ribosomal protein L11 methyltransferase